MDRSFSSASVHDGLAFVADDTGKVRWFESTNGDLLWTHDLGAHVFGSTLVAGWQGLYRR